MKTDSIVTKQHTWTFNKSELIDMMIEKYQKDSGTLIKDIEKKNCRLMANNKETHHVEMVFLVEKTNGADYNGK
jgi:hypothetical protein